MRHLQAVLLWSDRFSFTIKCRYTQKSSEKTPRDGDNQIQTSWKLFPSCLVHLETNIGTSVSLHITGSYITRSTWCCYCWDQNSGVRQDWNPMLCRHAEGIFILVDGVYGVFCVVRSWLSNLMSSFPALLHLHCSWFCQSVLFFLSSVTCCCKPLGILEGLSATSYCGNTSAL